MRRRQMFALQNAAPQAEIATTRVRAPGPEDAAEEKKKGVKPCPKCGKPGYYFHIRNCK